MTSSRGRPRLRPDPLFARLLLLASTAAACRAQGAEGAEAPDTAAGARVSDGVITGPGAAAGVRVVSLHDVTTEILVALGAVDRLVGVARPVEVPVEVARALAGVPQVEGAESIVKVRPTLVLGTDVVAERSPELVSFLRARGVPVWLAQPARLEDVFDTVGQVAARVGLVERGRALLAGLRRRAQAAARPAGARPVPVFVYDCCDPAFTAARDTVLTDVIARAGGRNIFADLDADWTKVSWEQVVARRPQLVLVHDYAYQGQEDVAAKRTQLKAIRSLAPLPTAVLPLGLSLGGIRSVDALERLAPILAQVTGR